MENIIQKESLGKRVSAFTPLQPPTFKPTNKLLTPVLLAR